MGFDYFWANKDSHGQRIIRKHGLKLAQPIMCSAPDSDNCMTMFQSGSKYYLWNPIEGGIWEIVTSMDLVEIVTKIVHHQRNSGQTARLDSYRTSTKHLSGVCVTTYLTLLALRRMRIAPNALPRPVSGPSY